jgi:hypothetical protein
MAGKGSPPGVRQGGRQKGTRNKATVQFEREASEQLGQRVTTRPNSKDELRKMAQLLGTLAAREFNKGEPTVVEVEVGKDKEGKPVKEKRKVGYDPVFLAELGERTGRLWAKLCEWEFPRLAAVTVTHEPLDLSRYTDQELEQLERLHAIGRGAPRALPGRVEQTSH